MNGTTEQEKNAGQDPSPSQAGRGRNHGGMVGGVIMIVLGLLFLAENVIPGFRFGDYWPVILIVIGIGLIWKTKRSSGQW